VGGHSPKPDGSSTPEAKTPADLAVERAENEIVGTWSLFGLLAGLAAVVVLVQAFQPPPGSSLWVSLLKGALGFVGLGGVSAICFLTAWANAQRFWRTHGKTDASEGP
jgi:hypothetical protein